MMDESKFLFDFSKEENLFSYPDKKKKKAQKMYTSSGKYQRYDKVKNLYNNVSKSSQKIDSQKNNFRFKMNQQ